MTGLRFAKQRFIFLTVLFVLSLAFVFHGTAEEKDTTLSGRVLSTEGEPIAGATMMLQLLTPQTDSEGRFTFTKITPSQTELKILRNPTPPNHTQIQTIKFGNLTFYPHRYHNAYPVTFAIEPGANIEDVEVIMERQLIVRGRVVFKDGEPLADTSLKININRLDFDGTDGAGFNRSFQTDADGNFVYATSTPQICMLSINYRGLSAASEPFIIEAAKPHETVVLTLNGNAPDLFALPPEAPKKQRRYHPPYISKVRGMRVVHLANGHVFNANGHVYKGIWIVNPANGHAYKWIACEDREDAQAQATVEGAHLVTITSEAEQIWLEAVFRAGPYWIGLSDIAKEGEWQWETGEPVTYTNWKADDENYRFLREPPAFLRFLGVKGEERFRREDPREDARDYVIIFNRSWDAEIGKWQTVHPKAARMAILEKEGN